MIVPITETPFPMRMFCLLPSLMPKMAMTMQPSHEAIKKTEAIKEIVFVFGYYMLVS